IRAVSPLPPWDNSAMDGFAIRAIDTESLPAVVDVDVCGPNPAQGVSGPWLRIVDTVAAGQVSELTVQPGQAIRIMTGAPMPSGADAVVMRENATCSDDQRSVQIHRKATAGQNIRFQGEDVSKETTVLATGDTLHPAAVGLCASVGKERVIVARRPTVAIIATGDEIVPPGTTLKPGQIHSSNTHALMGLVQESGGIPVDCGIAPDNLKATQDAFRAAMTCDLILSTGGVSVGDYDLVREAMLQEGAAMQFWKIKVKPGKPLAMGMIGDVPAFGLPGNPVSCQVGFLQFVRPWIRMKLGSNTPFLPVVKATLSGDLHKRPGRAEFVRVTLEWTATGLRATSTGSQGSGQQTSMVAAQGFAMLPEESAGAQDGQIVDVQLIREPVLPGATPRYPW
ncbi:MAG: gephyrin-like molybdotransferase Glp, partial [Myxococcota bacterium]